MEKDQSILNKIIQSKQEKDAYQLNAVDIISSIFTNLSPKEKEVIKRRFGLDGQERQTLEEIGKQHNITRERIRQIQTSVVNKIKGLKDIREHIDVFGSTVKRVMGDYGGLMEESHLIDELLTYSDNNPQHRQATNFIISQLLDDHIERVKKTDKLLAGWKLKVITVDIAHEILDVLHDIIEKENRLVSLDELIKLFQEHESYNAHSEKISSSLLTLANDDKTTEEKIKKIIYSYLKISQKLDRNILDEWGIAHWPIVKPKRMGDKVYLILKREKRPMHFTEITTAINEAQFDKKVAYPATIHNELILDGRFVLVGRGIYALKEWGYKTGTVSDVIIEILKNAGKPLTKDQIAEEVLKKRMVKKSTIYLALTSKDKFKKVDNTYALV